MNDVLDVIPGGNTLIPVMAGKELPVDILNRQKILDQLMKLLNTVSDSRGSVSFALNGAWGVGKTFVLNRLMKQLLDYQDGEKFFVFHYNCWQYDYYEEPLIAIVAAMLDSVDKENHLFSQSLREQAQKGLDFAKPVLKKIAKDFIQKKVGVDITDLITFFNNYAETVEGVEKQKADANEYDKYYSFKKAIQSARDGLEELAKERTVVVVVDELDRCLPDYAIKVMERLHHLFGGVSNCVVILSVDKAQLNQTIQQIFGAETDTSKYLRKFINFELELDAGRISGQFCEKYASYVEKFEDILNETEFDFEKFFSALFAGVDARTQERVMERIETVHGILFPGVKKDYSFMCAEVIWVVFDEIHNFRIMMPIAYDGSYQDQGFKINRQGFPEFTEYMKSEWSDVNLYYRQRYPDGKMVTLFRSPIGIPSMLIWYLYNVYSKSSCIFEIPGDHPVYSKLKQNLEDFRRFVDLLKIIK